MRTYNMFEVVRGMWKAVIVPSIRRATGVLLLSSPTRDFPEAE